MLDVNDLKKFVNAFLTHEGIEFTAIAERPIEMAWGFSIKYPQFVDPGRAITLSIMFQLREPGGIIISCGTTIGDNHRRIMGNWTQHDKNDFAKAILYVLHQKEVRYNLEWEAGVLQRFGLAARIISNELTYGCLAAQIDRLFHARVQIVLILADKSGTFHIASQKPIPSQKSTE